MATPNIVPRLDQEGGLGTADKGWGKLFVNQAASQSTPAFTLENSTVDQIALDINALNTTVNVVDIAGEAVTTADILKVTANGLTTGRAIYAKGIDSLTTASDKEYMSTRIAKLGVSGDGITNTTIGVASIITDHANPNHANSTVNITGFHSEIDSTSATTGGSGTNTNKGMYLKVTDATNNYGVDMTVENGGVDMIMRSSADDGDFCSIQTTTHGATTLTTVDDDAAAAHFEIAADGNITLDPAGTIALEAATVVTGPVTGTNYRTIWVDAGSMVPTVTNGAAAGTEELATNDVMMDYFAFDNLTAEFVQFKLVMPEQWDRSAIRAKFYYYTSVTSGDVNWKITANTFAEGDALDDAFGATVGSNGCHEVDDSAISAAGDLIVSGKTGDFTPDGSPGEGDLVIFRVSREPSQESSSANADLKLAGVNIQYGESATASAAW